MPPKKPPPVPKPVPSKGTLQHIWANAPKPKPKRAPEAKVKIPREFMTMDDRGEKEATGRSEASGMRGGDLKMGIGAQDDGRGSEIDSWSGRTTRKHDAPKPQAQASRRDLSANLKEEGKMQISIEEREDEMQMKSGGRSLRKHASTPVPELLQSRAASRKSESVRRTTEMEYDTGEAPESGRRSLKKHAPVSGSRSGTPVVKEKDSNKALKRTGLALSSEHKKIRRTLSPQRQVCFTAAPQTQPWRTVITPEMEKAPIVELPAFDFEWHRKMSPRTRAVEPPVKKERGRKSTPVRQSTPQRATNGVAAAKEGSIIQDASSANKVMNRTTRASSAAVKSPARGARSRTGTPKEITPPKVTNAEKGLLSFLSTLEESPSPPPALNPKLPINNSSFATNGKSSQSHRTVVEDTDAESESDSDDSLMDLQSLIRNSRSNNSLPKVVTPKKSQTRGVQPVEVSPAKETKYKFSLKTLVAQMEDSEKTDESAARVKKMMEDKSLLKKTGGKSRSGSVMPHDGHTRLLEEVVNENAEEEGVDAQKILKAVKRAVPTEDAEMVYYFFETGKPKKVYKERVFPKMFLETEGPKAKWHKLFGEKWSREACLGDNFFAQMLAPWQSIGEPMFHWVLEEVAKESNEMFRQRYVEMLLHAPITMGELLTPEIVRTHFRVLGAKRNALDLEGKVELEPMQENPYPGRTIGDHWGELWHFLRLLGHAAPILSAETREYALGVVLRLCADKLVRTHISLQQAVHLALVLLSEACKEEEWKQISTRISKQLYGTIPSAQILVELFSSVPSRPRLHNFHRRLAYAWFLKNPSLCDHPIQETFSISELTRVLETERFTTTRETKDKEYSDLDAQIQLLDAALDSGSGVTPPKLGYRHAYHALLAAGVDVAPPKLSRQEMEVEEKFNHSCDILSNRLNIILNGIQDLGPGHAERSDCRASLECVKKRLEQTVRTRVKPRDSNFEMPKRRERDIVDGGGMSGEKKSLQRFLKKGVGEKVAAGGGDGAQDEVEEKDGEPAGDDLEARAYQMEDDSEPNDAPVCEGDEDIGDAEVEARLLLARYA